MIINTKRKTDNKENIDGKCGKRLKQVYGKRIAIIIQNGNILYQIPNNNHNKNLLFQKMIPIFKHYKLTFNKEKKENKKIINKQKNSNKKEINS